MVQWSGCGEAIGGMSEAADANHANMHQHHHHTNVYWQRKKKAEKYTYVQSTADIYLYPQSIAKPKPYYTYREKEDSCWMAAAGVAA